LTVSIDNFPHHLHELTSVFIVQHFGELTGKAVEIDCVAIDVDGFFEQTPGGVIIELEPGPQYAMEGFTPNFRHLTIDAGDAREQCSGREPAIVIIDLRIRTCISSQIGEKEFCRAKHCHDVFLHSHQNSVRELPPPDLQIGNWSVPVREATCLQNFNLSREHGGLDGAAVVERVLGRPAGTSQNTIDRP